MEWRVRQSLNPEEEIASADFPNIRHIKIPHRPSRQPEQDVPSDGWEVCHPDTVAEFTAVGYYFARNLQHELKVPIGLIGCNWGGTRIEPWTTLDGFKSVPELESFAKQVQDYTAETKVGGGSPAAIYNSMVHPLAPFAMRGGIWYQGESNGGEGRSYYHKKHALVNGWRKVFQNDELAFYWVQLANFRNENPNPAGGGCKLTASHRFHRHTAGMIANAERD